MTSQLTAPMEGAGRLPLIYTHFDLNNWRFFYFDGKFSSTDLMEKTRSNLDFDWSYIFKRSWESFVSKESVQKSKDGGGFE